MIGIVVLNYNTWEESRKCVESLLNINEYKDIFIYIVDNHSTVVAPEKFVDFINADSRTELIWNTKNSGYNAGNNVGIRKALQDGCDYILVSNNDVTYDQDTIRSMVSMFSLHPDVGIVGPKIIEGNGSIQEINMLVPTTLGGKYKYLLGHTPFKRIVRKYINTFSADRSNLSAPFYVSSVSGACLLISRECCQAIFPFDEFPFLYEEEIMLGLALSKTRFKTLLDTNATVHHVHGASTHGIVAFSFTEFVRSEMYYCLHYLHSSKVAVMPLYLIRCVQYFSRCLVRADYRQQLKRFFARTRESFKSA